MPDRIVRAGIITSDSVNTLSWASEVFYRRLMSVVDDFGRYDGRPSVLRAALYPLKLNAVSEPDVAKWIRETEEAALVRGYSVEGRHFVEILKFNQRLRALKSKWPAPVCGHPPAIDSGCTRPSDSESESPTGKGDARGKGDEVFPQLKRELGAYWKRVEGKPWDYEDERLLFEICRSPTAVHEWNTIISFRSKVKQFQCQSMTSLLQNWNRELDKARNYEPPQPLDRAGNPIKNQVSLMPKLSRVEREDV